MKNMMIACFSLLSISSTAFAMSPANVIAAIQSLDGNQNIREIKPAAQQPANAGHTSFDAVEITTLQYTASGPQFQTQDVTVGDGVVQAKTEINQ